MIDQAIKQEWDLVLRRELHLNGAREIAMAELFLTPGEEKDAEPPDYALTSYHGTGPRTEATCHANHRLQCHLPQK